MKFLKFYLLIFISINLDTKAATCTAIASTNWTLASTWSCGAAPSCNDIIVIPATYTVTINNTINLTGGGCTGTKINIYGTLFFSGNGSRLDLVSTSTINIYSGGKITTDQPGNNSQKINIGNGSSEWSSNNGNLSGPWTLSDGSSGSNPALPIQLIEFKGGCTTNGIELNWSTATEKNNNYFLLESSFNGYDWANVAKVSGSGTSTTTKRYSYVDNTKNSELTYYRLSQVDYSGETAIFKVIDVNCKTNSIDQMVLYPNPASSELNLLLNVSSSSNNNQITVVNSFGQVVITKNIELIKGQNSLVLPVALSSGTYSILIISDKVSIPTQKLIVIN